MHTAIDLSPALGYKSRSQIARVCTECWAEDNLYCIACQSDCLNRLPNNERAIDFRCGSCGDAYQLKSGSKLGRRIVDAAHATMISAIRSDQVPNLVYLHYGAGWSISNLLLIPSFFFGESCIRARPPLAPTAKRAGWVGCEILLDRIAPEGKLWMIREGDVCEKEVVRANYQEIRPLKSVSASLRGWTLDVLTAIHRIGGKEFTLEQMYAFEFELSTLHPNNNNVRAKVRQQLQILRDIELLDFVSPGRYRLR